MKTFQNLIPGKLFMTAIIIGLSLFLSCKSGEHSDNMQDTTTTQMNAMKTDTVKTDTTMAPIPAKKKKGVGVVNEPVAAPVEKIEKEKDGIYNHAEIAPVFPGGQTALDDYIKDNIKYPNSAMENGIEGKVVVKFEVDEHGNVSHATVLTPPLGYGIEEEAMRVVSNMPKWTPGKVKGKDVNAYCQLPLIFRLE